MEDRKFQNRRAVRNMEYLDADEYSGDLPEIWCVCVCMCVCVCVCVMVSYGSEQVEEESICAVRRWQTRVNLAAWYTT